MKKQLKLKKSVIIDKKYQPMSYAFCAALLAYIITLAIVVFDININNSIYVTSIIALSVLAELLNYEIHRKVYWVEV